MEDLIVRKLRTELAGAVEEVADPDEEEDEDEDEKGEEEREAVPTVTSSDSTTWESLPSSSPSSTVRQQRMHYTVDTSEASYAEAGASHFSPNVRQAMLYRIRKKKGLCRLVKSLGTRYSALATASSSSSSSSVPPLLVTQEAFTDVGREERTKRITDLVASVVGSEASEGMRGDRILGSATRLSDKWSAKGLDL